MAGAVVHLVWAPLGPEPLRRFLRALGDNPPGADHELIVLLNGAGAVSADPAAARDSLLAELEHVDHRLIEVERPMLDLAAYGVAAEALEHDWLCIVNSYSEPLVPGWLDLLARAAGDSAGGIVGATGSWETQADWRRNRPLHQAYDLLRLRGLRRDFAPFPNPHLRTNAFLADRRLLLDLHLERARDKRAAYVLESGRSGIASQVAKRGGRLLVVGRDGEAYDSSRWATSRTFRSAAQENLLVADNQTRDYETAPPAERDRLRRATWGDAAPAA